MPDVQIGSTRFWAPASQDEFFRTLQQHQSARDRAAQRAKTHIELTIPVNPPATSVYVGQAVSNNTANGPEEGYLWSLRMISIKLSGTGTLNVYKSSDSADTRRPIFTTGTGQPIQVATWSSDAARIKHGEGILIVGSATLTNVYVSAWQVPAEREGELYD